MIVLANSGTGKQVVPLDYRAEISQRLIDSVHSNDQKLVFDCLSHPFVDVNFVGAVSLRCKKTEVVLHDESPHEVCVEYEEFKTEVTALFLAAHAGHSSLVRKLSSLGANLNEKLFRGYATTAAARECHCEILQILVNSGASQESCEEALLEASYLGLVTITELLIASDLIRPHIAVHALVSASCRGYTSLVDTLIKYGVDANANARVLLRSSKPVLHANFDCNALTAAIVSKQVSVVRLLLQVGVRLDFEVRLGAWAWDMNTGEEFRVGAGLAEGYRATWCAVEYFEASGSILRMLLQHLTPNTPHLGRTLIHHAILCNNARAVELLINYGADKEFLIKMATKSERPVHLAVRLGSTKVLEQLAIARCNLNSRAESGETALMICARHKQRDCLKVLAAAGADFGLVTSSGQSVSSIASSTRWAVGFQQAVLDVIHSAKPITSSNSLVFSPLIFVTKANDIGALRKLIERSDTNLDEQDKDGFSAAMIAVSCGYLEAFRLLIFAGANIKLQNKYGETVNTLSELNQHGEAIEKIMLEYAIEEGHDCLVGIDALHHAASRGDIDLVQKLIRKGHDVNATNNNGYTPLMLAANGGHGKVCKFLISQNAKCDIQNSREETALTLARRGANGKEAERVIMDSVARKLVLEGARIKKHTKCGKGKPHYKVMKMVSDNGVLRWGKSSKRNVVCKEAEVGVSLKFKWNRRKKLDAEEPGIFHVVTTKNKEFHFVCEGGFEMAELWVRGIRIVTRESIFGN